MTDRSSQSGRMRRGLSLLLWVIVGLAALVACDTTIPTAPPITVNITAVDNTTALAEGVQEALAATDQFYTGATETVLAQGGITLTPSRTPTITLTPTPTQTRYVTATPTATASDTVTPTFAPYLTNTPGAAGDSTNNGWLRIINAWRDVSTSAQQNTVDVYINDGRVSRALAFGGQTTYYRALAGTVRVTLRPVDADVTNAINSPSLVSTVVEIPAGGITSVVAVNRGKGLELIPVTEDPSPLPSGMARLTILQAAPTLLESNLLIPSIGRALGYNLLPGSLVGPFDLPPGNYSAALYDAVNPDQLIMLLPNPIRLANRVNYILVMLTPTVSGDLTDVMLFSGITRKLDTDLGVRFVNISTRPLTLSLDSQVQVAALPVGAVSDSIPISILGSSLSVKDDQDHLLAQDPLGPWTNPDDVHSGKIVLLTDSAIQSEPIPITVRTLSQNAPTSAINANIRLIHGLPNTRPLTLQVRPVRTKTVINTLGTPQVQQLPEDEVPWITLGDATQLGAASQYASRTPEVYDVRVVLSGSSDVIGNSITVQLLPGGIYDFIALPGGDRGSFTLAMLEPDTQIGGGGSSSDNATAVSEAVNATLTAQAPQITATPSRANTSTPTRTPVATNTPRPSNTPSILPPALQIKPEPPLTALDSITVTGQNFVPGKLYTLTFDNKADVIANGTINADGSLSEITIPLKSDITPGTHTLKLCVDCGLRGNPQVQYAVFIVADSSVTATPTPVP